MPADQLPPSTPDMLAHSGWLATAVLAAWGWLMRMAMSRYFKGQDEQANALERLSESIAKLDSRLARIEGRFDQQDNQR